MKRFGICLQTFIPLRKDPSEQAEMVSQILFGETFQIMDQTKTWCQVICAFDGYTGWFDLKLLDEINEVQYNKANDSLLCSHKNIDFIFDLNDECMQPLVAGSSLPSFLLSSKEAKFKYDPNPEDAIDKLDITTLCVQFINAPYLWGGKTILGIDCSGLCQVVYKIMGTKIPRDASQQVKLGQSVSFINEAKAGDLAFFDNEEGLITHVGIIIAPNKIIHASGKVRLDNLDHQGIFNTDTQKYSHKLRVIRRILP